MTAGDLQAGRILDGNGNVIDLQTALQENLLINPTFRHDQENAGAAVTTTLSYPVDQWIVGFAHDGAVSLARVASDTPGGSTHRMRLTVTTADASMAAAQLLQFYQTVEGTRMSRLKYGTSDALASVARFGFRGPAGTYAFRISGDVASGSRTYLTEFTITAGEANADTLQTVSIPGDTSGAWGDGTGVGAYFAFGLASGTDFHTATPNQWAAGGAVATASTSNGMATINDIFEIFDAGWYPDPDATGVAPKFIIPDYQQELLGCMRYFWKTADRFVSVTTVVGVHPSMPFMVPMRATPTISATFNVGSGATFSADPQGLYQSGNHTLDAITQFELDARL